MEVTPAAERELRKLDPHIRKQVNRDILRLEENPRPCGVQNLETKEKLYRVYVGPGKNYHVIYQIRDQVHLVLVVKVGDRKEVYRRVKRNCRQAPTGGFFGLREIPRTRHAPAESRRQPGLAAPQFQYWEGLVALGWKAAPRITIRLVRALRNS